MKIELDTKIEKLTQSLIKLANLKHNFNILELANKLNVEVIKVKSLPEEIMSDHGFVIKDDKYILYCLDYMPARPSSYNSYEKDSYEERKEYYKRVQRWKIAEALGNLLYFIIDGREKKSIQTKKFVFNNQQLEYGQINHTCNYIWMIEEQFAESIIMPEEDYINFIHFCYKNYSKLKYNDLIEKICNEFGVTALQAVNRGKEFGIFKTEYIPEVSYVKSKKVG